MSVLAQTLLGIIGAIVAVGGGYIGYRQWLTAQDKIKLNALTPIPTFHESPSLCAAAWAEILSWWIAYCRSGKKADDIPTAPARVYAEGGWAGLGDWLGTGRVASYLREYRSFAEARAFVRSLGLKSHSEWSAYCKSGKKPEDIPAAPVERTLTLVAHDKEKILEGRGRRSRTYGSRAEGIFRDSAQTKWRGEVTMENHRHGSMGRALDHSAYFRPSWMWWRSAGSRLI